jgi:hypothetical protein
MALQCTRCAASLEEKAVDSGRGFARCSYCGSLVDLGRAAGTGAAGAGFRDRPEVPLPKGVTVSREGGGLVLSRRWFSAKFLFLIPFCLFWNGFLVVWYGMAAGGNAPLAFLLFPLLHVAVGIGLAWFCLAGILNTTVIRSAGGRLTVRHGPVPWPGNLDLGTAEVKQLWTKEKVSHGKNGTTVTYEVHLERKGREAKPLLKGLESVEQALFVEQRLERHLRIEDRAMAGEVAR